MQTAPQPADPARSGGPRSETRTWRTWRTWRSGRSRLWLALTVGSLTAFALSGCQSIGYVAHVSAGQLSMWWDRELLDSERVAQLTLEEKHGVDAIQHARVYAERLGLRPSTSYRHVIDRDEETAVRVVVGSPPNRLEPVTWWFPIVGRLAYRGYFDPERAERFAARLAAEGYDTYVRRAMFYSTLGYFDDPIPVAVLRWSEIDLFDVILHELVHGTVFVASDVAYNEALASFIAKQGTLQFLADRPADLAEARRIYADRERYARLIDALAVALEKLYAQDLDEERAREERKQVFARYQQEVYPSMGFETGRYDGFQSVPLSNAFVVAQRTYTGHLPCLEAELQALGGDLEAFIRAHVERPGRRTEPAELCGAET